MKVVRSSRAALALLLVAFVVLAEMQAAMADATGEQVSSGKRATSTTVSKKTKAPKIRRTIRLLEEPAVQEPVKETEPVAASPQTVEMKNVGSTNQVDVNPNISVSAPPAPSVSEPKESDDKEDESKDESKMQIVPYVPPAKAQPNEHPMQLSLVDQASSNKVAQLTSNSGNQLFGLGHNNGNVLSRVLSNSGNTETVHIEGVGNNKVTRISNVGNNDEHHVELPAPRRQAPLEPQAPSPSNLNLPLGGPLVQISMNNDGQVAQMRPAVNYAAAPPMPFAMRPDTIMGPLVYPQMAAQSPMMMFQPAPMMMMPQQLPMMMMSTMVTPRQWRRFMRAERKHRRCRHHEEEEQVKEKKEKEEEPKKEQKPVETIEIHTHKEPKLEEEEEHQVLVELEKAEKPKIVQLIKPVEQKPAPKIKLVAPKPKDDDDEMTEVIEWETVRMPKKKKVKKSSIKNNFDQ